ncbi:DUF1885 family protein [Falsibacillus albus]|uniref:DUF1885 family protein n=1 Tax=Falsibacillus albus TaxID=2478915 RepID=A0A3L7JZZ9_9BACI|nr:DUF1885 family protein [Falsibacillus albus]RLQ95905.1 DUF1885 family protein [Falsibacillus albus]
MNEAKIIIEQKFPSSTLNKEINDYIAAYKKTGEQLAWDYARYAFPYEICENEGDLIQFSGLHPKYHGFFIQYKEKEITVELYPTSTYGDKSKANELAKYIALKNNGILIMFNGRQMSYAEKKKKKKAL